MRLLRVLLLVLVLALAAAAGAQAASPGWTVTGISQELMCPVCKERLDMSSSPAADQIRAFLERAHARGLSKAEVKRELVAEYGEDVLAAPPRSGFGLTAWLIPALVLAAGAVTAALVARHWAGRGGSGPPLPAVRGAERLRLERRLDSELEGFE